ncbi:MAG: hypothetical protein ACREJB_03475, partial [Planctomycetaceae bacterium]
MNKNWLEWTVFAVGCVLAAGTLGLLGYEMLNHKDTPPLIEVHLGTAQPRSGHYVVPLEVFNRGNSTAEAVQVEVTLVPQQGREEKSTVEFAFLPRRSSR